jgi:hypothetical protein
MKFKLPFFQVFCSRADWLDLDANLSLGFGRWREPGAIPYLFGMAFHWNWLPDRTYEICQPSPWSPDIWSVRWTGREITLTGLGRWRCGLSIVWRGRYVAHWDR